ncbi:MAG TPA: hypothetical protein HPQ03_01505 [Deltaproteobacteria bacterium]|nr:hypothetical protein [Deltaproteobacteria bacterium]
MTAGTERAQSAVETNHYEPIRDLATASQQLWKPDWDWINAESTDTHPSKSNNALTPSIQPPPPGWIEE